MRLTLKQQSIVALIGEAGFVTNECGDRVIGILGSGAQVTLKRARRPLLRLVRAGLVTVEHNDRLNCDRYVMASQS